MEAVGDTDGGSIPFETSKDGHNLWSRVKGPGANEHAAETIDVPTTTLDGYLDRNGIADVPLTLIDVEGYETRVVRGMAGGISAGRYKAVVVEFHPWAFPDPEAEIRGIAGLFLAAGYAGNRFRHHGGPNADKDPGFYRLSQSEPILGPLTFDGLSSWEHYLFTIP